MTGSDCTGGRIEHQTCWDWTSPRSIDSTNAVLIVSPCRLLWPKFGMNSRLLLHEQESLRNTPYRSLLHSSVDFLRAPELGAIAQRATEDGPVPLSYYKVFRQRPSSARDSVDMSDGLRSPGQKAVGL